ncbi:MAG: PDDEXK nuclease domain-containing protein, partial [Chitinophagaceae bacterium]
MTKPSPSKYNSLLKQIRQLVEQGRHAVARHINTELLFTYWNIGKLIIDREKNDHYDEQTSRQLILHLSKDLTKQIGKGFSRSNLFNMRQFYLKFQYVQTLSGHQERREKNQLLKPKSKSVQTVSGHKTNRTKSIGLMVSDQLSWSHYCELLKCSDEMETAFYQQASVRENWSVRDLQRQMDSALFERIALSKNVKGMMKATTKGKMIERDLAVGRDPYVLEFLNIPENYRYTEKHLEQKIIDNLQRFILELGKGFAFIARQFRITLDNKHYHVDLVFYHRILKCFVLIDLKVKAVRHTDIGQMNLYLNYFETEEGVEGDNSPIGIILSKHKD